MDFDYSPKVLEARGKLQAFMDTHVYPQEVEHDEFVENQANLWQQWPGMDWMRPGSLRPASRRFRCG